MAAHVMISVIAIASAVSLLIVSPREAQRKALRALRATARLKPYPPAVVAKTSQDRHGIVSHQIWVNPQLWRYLAPLAQGVGFK
jgi:hypothetical protein